jgi:hypothetical protein
MAVAIMLLASPLSVTTASNLPEALLNMPIPLTSGEVVTLKQY